MFLRTCPILPSNVQIDYEKFKLNFLQSFRALQTRNGLDWMFQLADVIPDNAYIQSPQSASTIASDYAILAVNALESSKWIPDNCCHRIC